MDTGAEPTWVPRAVLEALDIAPRKRMQFQVADGSVIERAIGYAMVYAGDTETIDEVVFGDAGDLVLLGAHSLQGLNLKVDLIGKRLVAGGPMLAACEVAAA